jgi:hypothetical protein
MWINVDPVLDYSLTVPTIRFNLSESVRDSPSVSAGLGRGAADFSASHLLPFNRPDYLHEYSPYYGLFSNATLAKFIRYWARNSRNTICCLFDQRPIILSYRLHPEEVDDRPAWIGMRH